MRDFLGILSRWLSSAFFPSACSFDQVPFLMHDHDLTRTTNIREVKPEVAWTHSAFFNWTVLSSLNAGKWFLDPWVRSIPQSQTPALNHSYMQGCVLLLEIKAVSEDRQVYTQFLPSLITGLWNWQNVLSGNTINLISASYICQSV